MLEKLSIRNFQTHRKRDIVLGERVTAIIGPSDVGKSSVYRALKLVCINRPQGDSFVTYGESASRVTLRFDGTKVVRTRGKGVNTYTLGDKPFNAFGNAVPDTIRNALALSPLNFQGQHDAAYWFGESEGKVAQELNAIVNLGEIDELLSRLSGVVRTTKAEFDVRAKNVADLNVKAREAKQALVFDADVSELESLDAKVREIRTERAVVTALLETIEESKQTRKTLGCAQRELEVVVSLGEDYKEAWRVAKTLREGLLELERMKSRIPVVPDYTDVQTAYTELKNARNERDALSTSIDSLRDLYRTASLDKKALSAAETDLRNNTPETCPTCGQSMKEHTHE